jgi:hypothetical protein
VELGEQRGRLLGERLEQDDDELGVAAGRLQQPLECARLQRRRLRRALDRLASLRARQLRVGCRPRSEKFTSRSAASSSERYSGEISKPRRSNEPSRTSRAPSSMGW